MSSNLIDSHFRNVINYDTEDKSFPDSAKIVSPRPIYQKKSRHKIENYMTECIVKQFGHKYSMSFYIKINRSWLGKTAVKNFTEFPCVVFEKSRFNFLLHFHILYSCFDVIKYLKLGFCKNCTQKFPLFTILLNHKKVQVRSTGQSTWVSPFKCFL